MDRIAALKASKDKADPAKRALEMKPQLPLVSEERKNYEFFLGLKEVRPSFDGIDGLRGVTGEYLAGRRR